MTVNPPVITPPMFDNPKNGKIYPTYVPKTDADGNDIAGVRLPDVTVPLATYTGWALRAGAQAGDGCEGAGQMIPFAKTKAERMASGDPRPSVEERYSSARRLRNEGQGRGRRHGRQAADASRRRATRRRPPAPRRPSHRRPEVAATSC